jgi:general secretion pathway protein H
VVGGFTLIELLVVVVIIGITLSLVVVNFARDDKRVLTDEAQRLGLLLEHAHDEAVASAQMLSWSGDARGFGFAVANGPDSWTPLNGDDIFHARAWTNGVSYGGARVLQGADPMARNTRLVFSPSGFNAPFELTLAAGNTYALLSSDALGRIVLKIADGKTSAYQFGN